MNVIEVLTRHGLTRVDMDTPTRLLRAYFGDRWDYAGVEYLSEELQDEGTAFLERLSIEMRHCTPEYYEEGVLRQLG